MLNTSMSPQGSVLGHRSHAPAWERDSPDAPASSIGENARALAKTLPRR